MCAVLVPPRSLALARAMPELSPNQTARMVYISGLFHSFIGDHHALALIGKCWTFSPISRLEVQHCVQTVRTTLNRFSNLIRAFPPAGWRSNRLLLVPPDAHQPIIDHRRLSWLYSKIRGHPCVYDRRDQRDRRIGMFRLLWGASAGTTDC